MHLKLEVFLKHKLLSYELKKNVKKYISNALNGLLYVLQLINFNTWFEYDLIHAE